MTTAPPNTRRATFKCEADVATIYVYGDIGDKWEGIDAKLFVEDLQATHARELHLHFHSYGGDAFEAYAMYSQLRLHPARKIGHVDSIAASAAAHMLFACDEIQMAANSAIVIHNPWSGAFVIGDYRDFDKAIAEDLPKDRDRLMEIREQIANTISARAKELDMDATKELMDAETWIYPEPGVEMGLVDSVSPELNVAAKINPDSIKSRFANVPDAFLDKIVAAALLSDEPPVVDEPTPTAWRLGYAQRALALSAAVTGGKQ